MRYHAQMNLFLTPLTFGGIRVRVTCLCKGAGS